MNKKILLHTLISAGLFLYSFTAFAAQGLVEINQICASQSGCFSGDTVGYPVTIDGTAGRSYILTSDLIVPNENTDGILIDTPDISIDLNGFQIIRSGCENSTLNCKPLTGTGSGISVSNALFFAISVHDGSIVGMGLNGLNLIGNQATVKNMRVRWNRVDGIVVGRGSLVSENTLYANGHYGIFSDHGTTLIHNTARGNSSDGIHVGTASTVVSNTSYSNGGDGIRTLSGCLVEHNSVRGNTGFGLNLNVTAGYSDNVITGNVGGTVNGGFNLGGNFCETNNICP